MLTPITPFAYCTNYTIQEPEDPDPPDPPGPDLRVRIVTSGAVFAPFFTVASGGALLSEFSDDTTSSELTYSKDFRTAEERTQYLTSTPDTALQQINFGYDGGDGGDRYFPYTDHHAATDVLSISNVSAGAPGLVYFAASQSPMVSADFSGCDTLEVCEAFNAHSFATVNFTGCTALRRVCFEVDNLSTLDLSDALAIEDVRGRGQGIEAAPGEARDFRVTLGDCSALWHLCVGSQQNGGHVLGIEALASGQVVLPVLEQWWLFDGHPATLDGGVYSAMPLALDAPGNTLQSIWASGCDHIAFDATNVTWSPTANTELLISNNPFQSIDVTGCQNVHTIDISNCSLTEAQVDHILSVVATGTYEGGSLNLSGNAAPSIDGLGNVAIIEGRGYTVTL